MTYGDGNGNGTWISLKTWQIGIDFINNSIHSVSFSCPSSLVNFNSFAKFRFISVSSINSGEIYVVAIVISCL